MNKIKLRTNNPWIRALYRYREMLYFPAFSIFCMLVAAGRGYFAEFTSAEAYVLVIGEFILWLLIRHDGNRRIALCTLILITIGELIHAALTFNYYHDQGYKFSNSKGTIIATLIILLLVMALYGNFWRLLSSNLAIKVFGALSIALLVMLAAVGTGDGAKIQLGPITVLDLVKVFYILTMSGVLGKSMEKAESDPKVQRKLFWTSLIFTLVHVGMLAVIISDFGSLIIIGFVYLMFLFIFPNKITPFFFVLLAAIAGIGIILGIGGNIYRNTIKDAPAQLFASAFTDDIHDVPGEEGSVIPAMTKLREIAAAHLDDEELKKDPLLYENYKNACQMLEADENGDYTLTETDFFDAKAIDTVQVGRDLKETGATLLLGDYPAAICIAQLSAYAPFKDDYRAAFLSDKYMEVVPTVHAGYAHGLIGAGSGLVLKMYCKGAERFIINVLPEEMAKRILGFGGDRPEQLLTAERAMQIGGVTGADAHEFIYVPIMDSDMIYSEIVSQFGFAMGLFVIMIYMILFREGLRVERSITDKSPFHKAVALGFSLALFIQAMVIIGGNLGVFPLAGVTLPFIAKGGVSMVVSAAMIGMLLAISIERNTEENDDLDLVLRLRLQAIPRTILDFIRVRVEKEEEKMQGELNTENTDEAKTQEQTPQDEEETLTEEDFEVPLPGDEPSDPNQTLTGRRFSRRDL